jgi:indoleamine 2,3-dioxygenase
MPTLSTQSLTTLPLLRRAHLVLAFLLHFYVHTAPSSSPLKAVAAANAQKSPMPIPSSISVPLLFVSRLLGLPPILTYSTTVLWNSASSSATSTETFSLSTNPPNRILESFTNTPSEDHFYLTSALCELSGAKALTIMRQSLDELFLGDKTAIRRLTVYLDKLSKQIDELADIILDMMNGCDPAVFYHVIRPWFKGGDADGPGSYGWAFLGLEDNQQDIVGKEAENTMEPAKTYWDAEHGKWVEGRRFSGPSAGQSSVIHALDVFLTVDHNPIEETKADDATAASSASKPAEAKTEKTFLHRMLSYMPYPHRSFLEHLSSHPTPLRPFVLHHAESHPALAASYDKALSSLKTLREKHMRIASMYIIQQARRPPSEEVKRLMGIADDQAEAEEDEEPAGELRGTGGTPLFKFLKMCRDNTTRAMIGSQRV